MPFKIVPIILEVFRNASNCSGEEPTHDHSDEQVTTWAMYAIVSPILLVLGTFGNVLVFVVIGHVCPGTTASVHFRNLAVFDTISAYITVVPFFTHYVFNVHLRSTTNWGCASITFIRYTAGDVAIWLVLAITIDRFLAIWKPLKVRRLCLPSTAMRITIGLVVLATVKNLHILWSRGIKRVPLDLCGLKLTDKCGMVAEGGLEVYEETIRPLVALISVSVIPAFGILVCNLSITIVLCRNNREWRSLVRKEHEEEQESAAKNTAKGKAAEKQATHVRMEARNHQREKEREKSERNSFILTFTNSTAFLLLVLPSFLLCLLRHEFPVPFITLDEDREDMFLAITDALIIANHTMNFYICCLSSKSFRKKVRQTFFDRRK